MEANVSTQREGRQGKESSKTVAETAKELQQDLRTQGYYTADKLQRVFGDLRYGVEVQTVERSVALHRKA